MTHSEYIKALEVANVASAEFNKVQLAYRARTIGDTEFLAAKAIYNESVAVFDVAYAEVKNSTEVS
jgi:hypothetical protein